VSTLLAVYNSEGCVGRCDAKCYQAVGGKCDCICGGRNHGAGYTQAADNTRELASRWVADVRRRSGNDQLLAELGPGLAQETLF
jgi:hypothetical protein